MVVISGNSDLRDLRNAFGAFLTGVTVVTAREKGGIPRGFTANSFTSVSLDPPILLICVDKTAESFNVFTESPGFSVNILAEEQIETSGLFASKRPDKFDIAGWTESSIGYPLLDGCCAWFECRRNQVIDAGDHVIILGEILNYDYNEKIGLGYVRGGYLRLGLEQSALRAASASADVIVGAIVEHEGKLLLINDADTGELHVPASGLNGEHGSLGNLHNNLLDLGIEIIISSLFAVFEHEQSGQQFIYYRAKANTACLTGSDFWSPEEVPWHRIQSAAIQTMLERYIAESESGRYGVYFGGHRAGAVKTLTE